MSKRPRITKRLVYTSANLNKPQNYEKKRKIVHNTIAIIRGSGVMHARIS